MLTSPPQRRQPRPPSGDPLRPPRRSGANDNNRIHAVPPSPRRLAKYGRTVLRLNPFIRVAGDALNILENFSALLEGGYSPSGGWTLAAKCAMPDISYNGAWARVASNSVPSSPSLIRLTNACTPLQGANDVGDPFGNLNPTQRTVVIGRTKIIGSSYRAQNQECWARPNQGPTTGPEYRPARPAIALPPVNPSYWPVTSDPAIAPPLAAPAFAPPVPRALNPYWRAPNRVALNAPVGARPAHKRYGQVVPNDWSISITSPNPQAGGKAAPRTHELSPPSASGTSGGGKVKETKQKLSKTQAMFLKAVGMGTESVDFVNVLYQSIPSEYRPRWGNTPYEKEKVSVQEMMQTIFDHADKISLADFIHNYSQEQLEDLIYGKIGKLGGEASKAAGLNYAAGFNSVGSRMRKYTYDAEQEERNRLDGEN